jgi:hypothetical protein
MTLEFIHGEIAATTPRVFADVAKDVGELHGDTKRASARDHVGAANVAGSSEDRAAHFTDASRHALTIRLDVIPGPVFQVVEVQLQGIEEFTKGLVRHLELAPGARQFPQNRLGGATAERQERVIPKAMQRLDRIRVPSAAVDDVVRRSAGGVHGERRASLVGREEPAGHEERARVPGGDPLADSRIAGTSFPSGARRVQPPRWRWALVRQAFRCDLAVD